MPCRRDPPGELGLFWGCTGRGRRACLNREEMGKKLSSPFLCILTSIPAAFPLSVCVFISFLNTHTQKKKAVLARGRMKDVKSAFLSLLGSLLAKIALIFIAITQSRY